MVVVAMVYSQRSGRSMNAPHLRPCVVGEAVVFVRRVADKLRVVVGHCHQERVARVRLLYVHLAKTSAIDQWVDDGPCKRQRFSSTDGATFFFLPPH